MTQDHLSRLSIVRALLELSEPLELISEKLSQLPWDFDDVGMELTREHLADVLRRYLLGEFTELQIEHWANLIEGRDDVDVETDEDDVRDDVLFELANPFLIQPLDKSRAAELLKTLFTP